MATIKEKIEGLIKEINAQKYVMIAVSTGGPGIQQRNEEYITRGASIRRTLDFLRMDDPNPYADLWEWYGKWSSGDLPTYQSRRQYITELYKPTISSLESKISGDALEPIVKPTGWIRVDRGVDGIRRTLEKANNEEEYQAVGHICRETIISLAQAVYDPDIHEQYTNTEPSETDANRMLEAYFAHVLKGNSSEAVRRHAKSALRLAVELQHKRTADFRLAALCAEATRTVVNIVALISGRRDPKR